MDQLRRSCDQLYQDMSHEDGGLDLVHFPAPRPHLSATPPAGPPPPAPAPDQSDLSGRARLLLEPPVLAVLDEKESAEEDGREEEEAERGLVFGTITRQDARMVQALRLDEEDWREVEVQWEDNGGASSPSSECSTASFSRAHAGPRAPLALCPVCHALSSSVSLLGCSVVRGVE